MRSIITTITITLVTIIGTSVFGQDWSLVGKTDSLYNLTDLVFLDIESGVAINDQSSVWYTNSGGTMWTQATAPSAAQLNAIGKYGDSGLWIAGDGGILALGNINLSGPPTFSLANANTTANLNNVYFDGNEGWAVGDNGVIRYSDNQGAMWRSVSIPGITLSYEDVAVGRNIGIIVGASDRVVVSKNGGITWALGATLASSSFLQIELINSTFYALAEGGLMYASVDGDNWTSVSLPSNAINKFSYADGRFHLVGKGGESYRSGSISGPWTLLTGIPSSNNLQAIYCTPNGCFTGGTSGLVYFNCTHIEVGGIVWGDLEANCMRDIITEGGYKGVRVDAQDSMGATVATTSTDEFGRYSLYVVPGKYRIVLHSNNFGDNAVLKNLEPCGPATDPNLNVIGDQNGSLYNNTAVATDSLVDLRCGEEFGSLGVTNRTIDFGLTFACSRAGLASGAANCNTAIRQCNLADIESTCRMMRSTITNTGSPGCDAMPSSLTNASWYRVVGGTGTYNVNIIAEACFPGFTGSSGFKVGVREECSGDNIYCQDRCESTNKTISIPSSVFKPGREYSIWVDGCEGSICGFSIDITGSFTPFAFPTPSGFTCEKADCNTLCSSENLQITVEDNLDIYGQVAATYTWAVRRNGTTLTTQNTSTNEFEYTFTSGGTYEVCLNRVSNVCNTSNLNYCESFEVIQVDDEDFGTVALCFLDIVNYTGPSSVDDIPGGITDPNGDGVLGWQQPPSAAFVTGINQQFVTNPDGCMYNQSVFIEELPNSDLALVDTTLCTEDAFPVFILDEWWYASQLNRPITLYGQADNGCDSLNELSIYVIELEGGISTDNCDADGANLIFTPTTYTNTQNFPLNVEWRNSLDQLIPDDGDGDPFTITVPLSEDTYTMTATVSGTDGVTCPFVFTHTVNFELPIITMPSLACEDETIVVDLQLPTGLNTSNSFWNLDGASFNAPIFVNQQNQVMWDTPGVKTVILAYINQGCYVEQSQDITIIDRLDADETSCTAGEGFVTFTWPALTNQTIGNIQVINGPVGTQLANTYTVEGLLTGENVIINMDVNSTLCNNYTLTLACRSGGCDSTDAITTYTSCGLANSPLCDLSDWTGQCASLNIEVGTTNPGITCGQGPDYKYHWIPFTAGQGNYSIRVNPQNCQQAAAMQYAIFRSCDLSSPVVCSTDCFDTTFDISSNVLETGASYLLWLNGCIGLICDYTLEVVGNYTPFSLQGNPVLYGNGLSDDTISICDTIQEFSIYQNSNEGEHVLVRWTVENLSTGTIDSFNTMGSLTTNLDLGSYRVCAISANHPCAGSATYNICQVVQVGQSYDAVSITCDASVNQVVFTWNGEAGHLRYDIDVLTGQTGILDTVSRTFTVTGLQIQENVAIRLTVQVANGCGDLTVDASCAASECPMIDIDLGYSGPTIFCITDSISQIQLMPNIPAGLIGTGTFSGPGLLSSSSGTYLPSMAGVGRHAAVFIFITDDGLCTYSSTLDFVVVEELSLAFTVSNLTPCTGDTILVELATSVDSSIQVFWEIGGQVISGSGRGPYQVIFTTPGTYDITVSATDEICGNNMVSASISVNNCGMECLCPNLIDSLVACPAVYIPVCGCDNVTYDNDCIAQYRYGVPSWTNGPCNNTMMDTIRGMCDDGDPMTSMDMVQPDCSCKGTIIDGVDDLESSFTIAPNPSSGIILIQTELAACEVSVYSPTGQWVYRGLLKSGAHSIDLSDRAKGIYLVQLRSKYRSMVKRVLIMN